MASKESSTPKPRRRKRFCWISSCFGSSPVSDSDDTDVPGSSLVKASQFSWSRFRTMKRTVPVDVVADATPGVAPKENPASTARKKNFFQKFRKDTSSRNRTSSHRHRHQPQNPAENSDVTAELRRPGQLCHVASKCNARSQPLPLHRTRVDAARTGTRTSHPGSPERGQYCTTSGGILRNSRQKKSSKKCNAPAMGYLDSCVGLWVLAVTLALMLLCGRTCAIVCLTGLFYLLPRFRVATNMASDAIDRKVDEEIDMSSEEYKKRVVLNGLLRREGRRPSTTMPARAR